MTTNDDGVALFDDSSCEDKHHRACGSAPSEVGSVGEETLLHGFAAGIVVVDGAGCDWRVVLTGCVDEQDAAITHNATGAVARPRRHRKVRKGCRRVRAVVPTSRFIARFLDGRNWEAGPIAHCIAHDSVKTHGPAALLLEGGDVLVMLPWWPWRM